MIPIDDELWNIRKLGVALVLGPALKQIEDALVRAHETGDAAIHAPLLQAWRLLRKAQKAAQRSRR